MNKTERFYICHICGNIVALIENHNGPLACCGKPMSELTPNTVEASREKHLPVATMGADNVLTVEIGSVPHPMDEPHHISHVIVQTSDAHIRKCLAIGDAPKVTFLLESPPIAVYAYCNLHGLWMTSSLASE